MATKNIVPQADGEGSIGTAAKKWGDGQFTTLSASGLITATGGQIAFPATAVPSADPNTLDGYEEGTSETTLVGAVSGNLTLDAAADTLAYVKIGSHVHLQGQLTITGDNALSSTILMILPFTTASLTESADVIFSQSLVLRDHGDAGIENALLYIPSSTTTARWYNITDIGGTEAIDETRVDAAFRAYINFDYICTF